MNRRGRGLAALAVILAALWAVVGAGLPASAHPLSTSAVLLDLEQDAVEATIELPLDELSTARDESLTAENVLDPKALTSIQQYVQTHVTASDSQGRAWSTTVQGGQVQQVDGTANLVLNARLAPSSGEAGDFVLHDDAIIDLLVSHRIFVSARYGHTGDYTTLAMLSWQTTTVPVASAQPEVARGFLPAVQLGIAHITGGSDHLLFLITLLLPAPLVASARRWRQRPEPRRVQVRRTSLRVFHIVTAFAIGHSCTLLLGALGWVALPERLVESGIALSVLVSAVHAYRPLVRGGELAIAAGFGLLHGLAFASLLNSLDLERSSLLTTLLGFNLGIEVTQLGVVALVLPSLLVLSRYSAYPLLRLGGALVSGALATGWLLERLGLIPINPLEFLGDLLVDHPLPLALALAFIALIVAGLHHLSARAASTPTPLRLSDGSPRDELQAAGRELR